MASKFIYSPLKIAHHEDRLNLLRGGLHVAPLHCQIIPTNRCIANCCFCAYRNAGYSSNKTFDPRDEMPWDKLASIVRDCAVMGVKAVELTGGGEPTVHPQFSQLCDLIVDSGIDLGIVTNGMIANKHVPAILRAKWIRFSIDAGNANTYAKTRDVDAGWYHTVRDTVRQLSVSRTGTDPVIGVGFVTHRDNWQEILECAKNAKADGADNVRISAVFQNDGIEYFREFYDDAKRLCTKARGLADDAFTVFDLFGDRIEDLATGIPQFLTCNFQRLCTYIAADQSVYRCCVVSNNPIGLLGSIRDQSFMEFWNSTAVMTALRDFSPDSCPHCMFTGKNNTIAYLLEQDPPHVNFL